MAHLRPPFSLPRLLPKMPVDQLPNELHAREFQELHTLVQTTMEHTRCSPSSARRFRRHVNEKSHIGVYLPGGESTPGLVRQTTAMPSFNGGVPSGRCSSRSSRRAR